MRGWRALVVADGKLYLREPAAAFFTLVFPALILLIGGYSFGQEVVHTTAGGVPMRIVDVMLPSTLAWVMASQGLMGVYPVLTSLRESGALKYYHTHPIRTWHILLSQYIVGLVMLALSLVLLAAVGWLAFGIRADAHGLAFVLALPLAYTAFFALGFALAGLTPTARVAQAVGSALFFPLLFLSGSVGPRDALPPALKLVSDLSPLSHVNDLLTTLWMTGSQPLTEVLRTPMPFFGVTWGTHTWLQGVTPWHSLAYLVGLIVMAAAVALRTFRWGDETGSGRAAAAAAAPSPGQDAVVWARGLTKSYGSLRAVDGLDLTIPRGTIFGLLGPNGAGKTTTVEMLEGLRAPDRGAIRVLGLDPRAAYATLVMRIGVQLQTAALPSRLKVREALALFAAFYPRPQPVDTLLQRLELQAVANRFVGQLSGGQRQRLFAALALVNDPEVLFVDEITTGLDPAIRRKIWGFLRELRQQGKTIVLTTHYLEEAQALCDRVVILHQGRAVAEGRPQDLLAQWGARYRLEVEVDRMPPAEVWQQVPAVVHATAEEGLLLLYVQDEAGLEPVLRALREAGIAFGNLRWQPVTLEDIFLMLTRESQAVQSIPVEVEA